MLLGGRMWGVQRSQNRGLPRCAQVFHALDRDKDGLLSRSELLAALTQHGSQPLTQEEAEQLWIDAEGERGGVVQGGRAA